MYLQINDGMWADDGAVSSDDELSGVETDVQDSQTKAEDRELKETLLRKYGNHISSLKLEFSKKKKKGKLPKEARQILLEWWNVHYKWPYPTVSIAHLFWTSLLNYCILFSISLCYFIFDWAGVLLLLLFFTILSV